MAQATATRPVATPVSESFRTWEVMTIAGGHLTHDIFTSFLAPLLPLIIQKLGLSLTLAGSLASFQQLPSLINPFLGLLADRGSLRWLVVLTPTVTALVMCLMGIAPTYTILSILLIVAGFSTAVWHTPTPAMVARVSGRQVGQGMSFFMLGGSLAYTVGPLLAVAAVSWWGLEGIWRLIPLGVAASIMLYWRTRGITGAPSASRANGSWSQSWGALRPVMLPIAGIIVAQGFMNVALSTYLPTFLSLEGASLWQAGSALSIVEMAGAVGALVTGTVSDRLGRRQVLAFALSTAPLLMLLFLAVRGWAVFATLLAVGLTAYSTNPVMMALVQEHSRDHPATANGLYMATMFASRSLIIVAVGAMADRWGLRTAFQWSALLGFAAVGFVLLLPRRATVPRNE
jgi:MFS transporter, FSR family, fosmidomycin resistance protein